MPWPSNTPHLPKYKHISWHIYTSVLTYLPTGTHASNRLLTGSEIPTVQSYSFNVHIILVKQIMVFWISKPYSIMSLFWLFRFGGWCIQLNQMKSPWRWRWQVPPKWWSKLNLRSGKIKKNLTAVIHSMKTWQLTGHAISDTTFRVYHWTVVYVVILMLYGISVVGKEILLLNFDNSRKIPVLSHVCIMHQT